jgi:hypothetical protein
MSAENMTTDQHRIDRILVLEERVRVLVSALPEEVVEAARAAVAVLEGLREALDRLDGEREVGG